MRRSQERGATDPDLPIYVVVAVVIILAVWYNNRPSDPSSTPMPSAPTERHLDDAEIQARADQIESDLDDLREKTRQAQYDEYWRSEVERLDDQDSYPSAAGNRYDCGDFLTRQEAQAVLDREPWDPSHLDGDGDGQACDLLP